MPNNITFKVVNNGPHNSPRTEVKFYGLRKLVLGDVTPTDGVWDNGTWLITNLPAGEEETIVISVVSAPDEPVSIKAVVSGWYVDHVPKNNVVMIVWDGSEPSDVVYRVTLDGRRRVATSGGQRVAKKLSGE